jgi:hypothetical protein
MPCDQAVRWVLVGLLRLWNAFVTAASKPPRRLLHVPCAAQVRVWTLSNSGTAPLTCCGPRFGEAMPPSRIGNKNLFIRCDICGRFPRLFHSL